MRKVNTDTGGNNRRLKIPKAVTKADIKHQLGDLKPKRVPLDWQWSGGLARLWGRPGVASWDRADGSGRPSTKCS